MNLETKKVIIVITIKTKRGMFICGIVLKPPKLMV